MFDNAGREPFRDSYRRRAHVLDSLMLVEEEMLHVREDVKQINEKLHAIEDALRENGVIKKEKP